MRYGFFYVFIIGIISLNSVYADGLLIIDGLDKLKSCYNLAGELKLNMASNINNKDIRTLEYKSMRDKMVQAEEKFYRLEMEDALKIFDELVNNLSDAIISGGSINDINNLFQQSLNYKILILLSRKEVSKAVELLREYIAIFSTMHIDSKKIHPSLRNFLNSNLDSVKKSAILESELAQILNKSLKSKYRFSFDGSETLPDKIIRSRHILLIETAEGQIRSLLRDFSNDINMPISLGNYQKNYAILVLNEDSFKKAKSSNAGNEMLFCRENGDGLILPDGKVLSKEEAMMRDVKVEIIKTEEVEPESRWYNNWWVYAAGGTVVAAVITSIILINTDNRGTEFYRDRIPVK
ncbi:MAG: hypothetical protein ACP5QK_03480 [Myxococcota bacterium]